MTIKQVQCLLEYLGYSVDIDGIFGYQTKTAVEWFQKDFGLQADGWPGEQTYAALRHAVCYGMESITSADQEDVNESVDDVNDIVYGADQYLKSDGYYHIPRGVRVQLSKNLWSDEICCQGSGCCTESKISKRIVEMFQAIRDDMGVPLEIGSAGGSGYRCPAHNADVGGASGSLHMISEAVDIHYRYPAKLKECVLRHLTDGEVGLYSWGCHVGCWDRGYISEFNG